MNSYLKIKEYTDVILLKRKTRKINVKFEIKENINIISLV